MPAPFRLYNTLSRTVERFSPRQPGVVRLYVCGMTVYAPAHVGHARMMVVFDVVVRYLRHRGWSVDFVRNYTDIDDKIIRAAHQAGVDPLVHAQRYVDEFRRDARDLGLLEPNREPRVTEHVGDILTMIATLIERGHAYEQDGSVWFSVETWPAYGHLSNQKVEALRSEEKIPGKHAPADFALWKAAKPDEPSWPSPWGPGRPGWHIECSAMAHHCLGELDIHGGGLDLVFPHHENEIAQSEAATGHGPFARYWMHNGLLTMPSGEKMGKSLGNSVDIANLLLEWPAEAVRLYYLQNHYRSPLPWNSEALPEALAMLARLYEAQEVAESLGGEGDPDPLAKDLGPDAALVLELGRSFADRFHEAMDEDFNTAQALGHAFELARAINRFSNHKAARMRGGPIVAPALRGLRLLSEGLGLLALGNTAFQEDVKNKRLGALGISRADVQRMLDQRVEARRKKDWAQADALRVALDEHGIVVMDRADGVDWRVRLAAAEPA
jgi:cysteinyl-tRNA synthetase